MAFMEDPLIMVETLSIKVLTIKLMDRKHQPIMEIINMVEGLEYTEIIILENLHWININLMRKKIMVHL